MSTSEKRTHRANRPGAAAKPFSIRLTDAERQRLTEQAGRTPLATYLRDLLLARNAQVPRMRTLGKVENQEALARVLAALGQSRIANNLNQLAKAVNIGALPVSPETEREISDACAAVICIRQHLISALGLSAEGTPR